MSHLIETFPDTKIDQVVGLGAGLFLLGPSLALAMNVGFVPIRKGEKLSSKCYKAEYKKEHVSNTFEMQEDAIPSSSNIVVIDGTIATGRTTLAAKEIIQKAGANVLEFD